MDVNGVLGKLSYANKYDNSTVEKVAEVNNETNNQTNNQIENAEASSIEKNDEKQDITKDNSNKSNNEKDINKTIDKLNKLLEKDQTHAEYSYYKELNRSFIKIVDDKTKKVVMEFPSEKLLDSISSLLENAGIIDEKA